MNKATKSLEACRAIGQCNENPINWTAGEGNPWQPNSNCTGNATKLLLKTMVAIYDNLSKFESGKDLPWFAPASDLPLLIMRRTRCTIWWLENTSKVPPMPPHDNVPNLSKGFSESSPCWLHDSSDLRPAPWWLLCRKAMGPAPVIPSHPQSTCLDGNTAVW